MSGAPRGATPGAKGSALLIMARRPAPHRSKTRLTPPLKPAMAAALYEAFLQDTVARLRRLQAVTPFLAYTPADQSGYFRRLAPDYRLLAQEGASLGARLDRVLTDCLQAGYGCAVAVNSDSPTLPAAYVQQGIDRLADPAVDVVLGGCEDGGYYLIGWKRPHPRLVREVPMSTPTVLVDTLALADALNLRVARLPTWYDVDTVADLARLQSELVRAPDLAPHTARVLADVAAAPLAGERS